MIHIKESKLNSLCTARSALQTVAKLEGRSSITDLSSIERFITGIFNLWPPKPKNTQTYDTNVVLTYTKTLPENRDLSLKQIAPKLAYLCFKPHIVYSNEGCNIYLDQLEKYDTQGGKCNTIT